MSDLFSAMSDEQLLAIGQGDFSKLDDQQLSQMGMLFDTSPPELDSSDRMLNALLDQREDPDARMSEIVEALSGSGGGLAPEDRRSLMNEYRSIEEPRFQEKGGRLLGAIGTAALETGAASLVPQASIPANAGRLLRYGKMGANALKVALGAEAGRQVAERSGMTDETGLEGAASRVTKGSLIGGALGIAGSEALGMVKATAKGVKNLRAFSDEPKEIARQLGATAADLKRKAGRYVVPSVNKLIAKADAGDEFANKVLRANSADEAFPLVSQKLDDLGNAIKKVQAEKKNITFNMEDIYNHPKFDKVLERVTIPTGGGVTQSTAKASENALEDFISALPPKGKVDLGVLWKARKDLDKKIVMGVHQIGVRDPTIKNDTISDLTDVIRDVINKSTPEIKELNKQYSELAPIYRILVNGESTTRPPSGIKAAIVDYITPNRLKARDIEKGADRARQSFAGTAPKRVVVGSSLLDTLLSTQEEE